jgi:Tol biopolymer transport system component
MNQQPWKLAGLFLLVLALAACGGNGGGGKKEPPSASKSAGELRVTAQREVEIENARLLSLSPDGQWLAAQTGPDQLCFYQAQTLQEKSCASLERELNPSLQSVTWSPDGSRIALTDEVFRYMIDSDLWVIKVESGEMDNLTDDGAVGGFLNQAQEAPKAVLDAVPAWSPDGKKLTFTRSVYDPENPGGTDILQISADGGTPEKLLTVGAENPLLVWHGMQWSDDGKKLYYSVTHSKPDYADNGIWSVDQGGKNAKQLIGSHPDLGPPILVAVASKQNQLLFVYYRALGMLGFEPNTSFYYLLDLKSGATTPLKQAQSDEPEFFALNNATLSPDGSKVLYVYRTLEEEWRLAVRDLDDETEHVLATFNEPVGASREMGMGLNWAANDTLYVARALGQAGLLLTLGAD